MPLYVLCMGSAGAVVVLGPEFVLADLESGVGIGRMIDAGRQVGLRSELAGQQCSPLFGSEHVLATTVRRQSGEEIQ